MLEVNIITDKEMLIKFLKFRKAHPELRDSLATLYDKFNRDLITIEEILYVLGI